VLLDQQKNRSIIDFMRALGIILVICFHVVVGVASLLEADMMADYIAAIPPVFNILWQAQGSELVFLFSGFLLSYLLLRELKLRGSIDLRDFYVRRAARIVPLYLVGLAFYALIGKWSWTDLLFNLLFISKLVDARTIIPVGWSLEVLVQSFLILPVIALVFIRSRIPVILALAAIIVSLVARYLALIGDPESYRIPIHMLLSGLTTPDTIDDLYYHLGYRATPFLLGFLVAYFVVYKEALIGRIFGGKLALVLILPLSVVIIIAASFLPVQDPSSWLYAVADERFTLWYWVMQRFVFAVGVCLLTLVFWHSSSRLFAPLIKLASWRMWHSVAENIYSIYLFHPVFLIPGAIIGFRTWKADEVMPVHMLELLIAMVVAAILSTLLGKVLTRYIEAPSRSWVRKRYGR
jgi:peptidoglycan/LPS O-acetylase OafA/YrhL